MAHRGEVFGVTFFEDKNNVYIREVKKRHEGRFEKMPLRQDVIGTRQS